MISIMVLLHKPLVGVLTDYLQERNAQDVTKKVFLRGSKQWIRMLNIIDTASVLPQYIKLLIFG